MTAGDPQTEGLSVKQRYYTLAQMVGWRLAAQGAAQGVKLTTRIRLRYSNGAGLGGALLDDVEGVNRALTKFVHRAQAVSEFHRVTWLDDHAPDQAEDPRPDWHMHGCDICGCGTSCTDGCSPGDANAALAGRLYPARRCEGCNRAANAA